MKSNDDSAQTQDSALGRGKPCKERPWCWQEKRVLRTIDNIFDATNDAAAARSVYLAMTEIASDEQSDTFTKPIANIARRAHVSYRTASEKLKRFEALEIIRVERNTIPGTRELGPSTYTLGNGCLTLGNGGLQASLPRDKKNLKKNLDDEPAREAASAPSPSEESSSSISVFEDAKKHPYWRQFKSYCESRRGSPTLKGFQTWLKKQPSPKGKSERNGAPSEKYAAALRASMETADREHDLPSRFSLPVPPECDGTKAAERRPSRPAA
jgi:hypothetical protein